MTFGRLMSVPIGRFIRAVVRLMLISLGFFRIGGPVGRVLGLVGFVPLSGGSFNFCVLAPLFGGYLDGRKNLEGVPPRMRGGAAQH
jgi:hypothetical protein